MPNVPKGDGSRTRISVPSAQPSSRAAEKIRQDRTIENIEKGIGDFSMLAGYPLRELDRMEEESKRNYKNSMYKQWYGVEYDDVSRDKQKPTITTIKSRFGNEYQVNVTDKLLGAEEAEARGLDPMSLALSFSPIGLGKPAKAAKAGKVLKRGAKGSSERVAKELTGDETREDLIRENPFKRGWRNLRQWGQDRDVRIKALQNKPNVKVDETSDIYLKKELYPGRVSSRIEETKAIVEDIVKDRVATAKKLKIKDDDFKKTINRYLVSRHAPERNLKIGEGAAGINTKEALQEVSRIKKSPAGAEVERIANRLSELNKKTLDVLKEGGVIDDVTYKTLRKTYKNHVPLNRIMDQTDDIVEVLSGRGFDVRGTGIKAAKGSQREIADITENIVTNLEKALIRAEKNKVNQSVLNFARQNKEVLGNLFEEVKPKAVGKTFDGKPILKQVNDPNVLVLREKGKPVYIRINDNKLATVIRGIGDDKLESVFRVTGAITRFYAGLHTRYSLEFPLTNKLRDLQEAFIYNLSQKGIGFKGASRSVFREGGSFKGVTDYIRGKDTPDARLYKQMKLDGGTTGGMALSTRRQVEIDVAKLEKLAKSKPRKAAEMFLRSVDNWNTIFEDTTRLSAYKEALARGFSRERAASIAKNSTVNFDRKGTGGPLINSLYMFANASIQGSSKMLAAMKNPKVAATVISSVGLSTIATNNWNDQIDPEWRKKVKEWDRLNNLIILTPSGDGGISYITIPTSYAIKPIKVLTESLMDSALGKSDEDPASRTLKALFDAYNPIGGTDFGSTITPTIADIPMDIIRNRAWHGGNIRPDWLSGLPKADQVFKAKGEDPTGAKGVLTDVLGSISEKTGRRIDISPEDVIYAFEQVIGGAGRSGSRVINTLTAIGKAATGKGEALNISEIPFINRLFKHIEEERLQKNMQRNERTKFLDQTKKLKTGSEEQKQFIQNYINNLTDDSERRIVQNQLRDSGFPISGLRFSQISIDAQKIYDQIKGLQGQEFEDKANELIGDNSSLWKAFNKIVKEEDWAPEDKVLSGLGVYNKERATKVYENSLKIKGKDDEETRKLRNDYINSLIEKGIVTEEVEEQLLDLIEGKPTVKLGEVLPNNKKDKSSLFKDLMGGIFPVAQAAESQPKKTEKPDKDVEKVLRVVPESIKGNANQNVPKIIKGLKDNGVKDNRELAYALATAEVESHFKPVREGFAETNEGAIAAVTDLYNRGGIKVNYALPQENGHSYYGRGWIQLTWPHNYKYYGQKIGMGDDLYNNPDKALEPDIAIKLLHVYLKDAGVFEQVRQGNIYEARRIVNGTNPDTGQPNGLKEVEEAYHRHLNALNSSDI